MSNNLIALVPTATTPAMLSSTSALEAAPTAYASAVTYGAGAVASVAGAFGLMTIYRSLQATNVGHDPSSSPTWWEKVGSTYKTYAAGSYAAGDRVIDTSTHLIYESLFASNTALPSDVTKWTVIGPTAPWAMFDGSSSTQTLAGTPLSVVLKPGPFNAVYIGGADCDQLQVIQKDAPGGSVIDTRTIAMENSAPADYWEYFFDPFRPQRDALLTDFIPYGSGELTVILSGANGMVGCGVLSVGSVTVLGQTLKDNAKVRPKTFSSLEPDGDGNVTLTPTAAGRDLSISATVIKDDADWSVDQITALQGITCLFAASNASNRAGLRAFGLGSAEVDYGYSDTHARINLDVKGIANVAN